MTKQQRKIIDAEFYRYYFNKKTAENYVVEAAVYSSFAPAGERVKTSRGNSSEKLIINAVDEAEEMRRWCKVFEKTLDKFHFEQKDRLMQKRYIERKSVWRTCEEIGIERRTYFYWLKDILQTACLWAQELKLI